MTIKTALLLAQTILIAFLIFKIFSIESKLSFYAENTVVKTENRQPMQSKQVEETKLELETQGVTIADIRRVVREEFKQLQQTKNSVALVEPSKEPSANQIEQNRIRLEQVNQKVDSILLMGALASQDLEAVFADISRLEKNDQKHILKRLTQAVNSGGVVLTN